MNSVNWTGKLVGCAIFEPLVERLGYKKTIYILACIQIVAVTISLSSSSWIQFCIGRVLAYLAVGIVEPTIPTYQAELAPAAIRDDPSDLAPHLYTILYRVAQMAEALNNMNRIRPRSFQESGRTALEVDAFEQAIQENMTMNRGSWLDLFSKTYLSRTIIVTLMFFFQQTTGQQFANSYGPTFFKSMHLPSGQLFSYSILIPLAGLCGCIIAVLTTDTVGRRTLCCVGAALATMFAALIGSVGSKPGANDNTTDSNVVIASVILLNGVCKLGVASQCWLIGSEIGGIQMRKKLMGLGVAVDVFAAFLVTFFTPYLQNGPHIQLGAKVGYIFMGLAALSFIFFILFIPELKGRSLEEVDELFERKLWAWQFSKAQTHGIGNQIAAMEDGSEIESGKAQLTATHIDNASNMHSEEVREKSDPRQNV
ncbi:hypothetical protein H2202_005720 [Exophiala xenobiotica]|nr:hypothetical protein H2202_005720 [Exophiala xenobiotica]